MINIHDLLWPILALSTAAFSCINFMTCQFYKTPGQYLVLWSRIMTLVAILPIVFFLDWPDDWRYYAAVAGTGVSVGLADTMLMNATARYGGGAVSRVMPFLIFMTFILWLAIRPAQIFTYLESPLRSGGILIAMCGCVYFAANMRHCPVSRGALKAVMPSLICFSLNFVLAKYAFEHAPFHSGVYYYILIQTLVALPIVIAGGMMSDRPFIKLEKTMVWNRTILWPAFLIFFGWMLQMVTKNYANSLTPNPAYVAALNMTAPVWMILIYKIIGYKDDADVKSGIGLMASAILLSLLGIQG